MSSAADLYPAPGAVPAVIGAGVVSARLTEEGAGTGTGDASKGVAGGAAAKAGRLAAFEGFLKKAGQIAGVVLADLVKYVLPIAGVVGVADPAVAPAAEAFTASVRLVQAAAINVEQKWASSGSEANAQKLADVLAIVEQPVVTMFAQVGLQVDTAYVINLVNGVVAILNAQPGAVLQTVK